MITLKNSKDFSVQEVVRFSEEVGLNSLTFGVAALRSPIGFAGGALAGALGYIPGKLITKIINKYFHHDHVVSKTIRVVATPLIEIASLWGILAIAGYKISALSLTIIYVKYSLILTALFIALIGLTGILSSRIRQNKTAVPA